MRIVICEFMDERAVAHLRALRPADRVDYDPALVDRPEGLAAAAADADALVVRNRTQVRGALLAGATRLRVVGRLGVGLDNIDTAACAARRIEVLPATGANADAVAEYVIAAALVLLRGAFFATDAVRAGQWPRARLSEGREVAGKRLGLAGFGDIGRRVARRARALGMDVVAHDPQIAATDPVWAAEGVSPVSLDDAVASADVLSLHVPLVQGTRHLLSAQRIAGMKPGSVVINTARGGVVDEDALAAALRAGRLGGAALDVFEVEPQPAGERWAGIGNLILTPHVGGVTAESNERVSFMIAERVAQALIA